MIELIVNAKPVEFPAPPSIAELLQQLAFDPRRVAVEVNRRVVPRVEHDGVRLAAGDAVEVVTLVGGGSEPIVPADRPLVVGPFRFASRLFTGTGKYANFDLMRDCLAASGCNVTTVAVRRERLVDAQGRNLLDYLDL